MFLIDLSSVWSGQDIPPLEKSQGAQEQVEVEKEEDAPPQETQT
jgi:hypothetical protein